MRKILLISFTFIGMMLLFNSCNTGNKPIKNLNFSSAQSQFLGDPQRINVDFYDLYLYDSNLTNNPNGDGTFAYIQLNTAPTTTNEIKSGNYTSYNSSQPFSPTFETGNSYIGMYVNGQLQKFVITDGQVSITQNNQYYTIKGIVSAGAYDYNLSYSGTIEFSDMVVPLPNTLTHGEIWYNGDPYGQGLKIYSIRLGAENVKIADFSGSGDAMQIEIYTPLTATTIIPDGTYPVKVNQVQVNTAIDGYYDTTDKANYGTWYYTADALSINSGYVRTQYLTGSTYNITFNFTDDYYGYTFSGTYQGELAFVNKTNSPVAVRAAVRKALENNVSIGSTQKVRSNIVRERISKDLKLLLSDRNRMSSTQSSTRVNRK